MLSRCYGAWMDMDAAPYALSAYEFDLPEAAIARSPASPRDASRIMVLPCPAAGADVPPDTRHHRFSELAELLRPDDLLVVNRTKVIPARLRVHKASGGKVELLLIRPLDGEVADARLWEALARPTKGLEGRTLTAADGTQVKVVGRGEESIQVAAEVPLMALLESCGEIPLPPYIERQRAEHARQAGAEAGGGVDGVDNDADDYQTLFAREHGAVAAPTAGLHFTDGVMQSLQARGVQTAELILHVGPGTFLPVRPEHEHDVREHLMHAERYEVPEATVEAVRLAQEAGRRIVAVGTTSVRALETWATTGQASGDSRLFIVPGFEFQVVGAMITNFHLPRSTLLMLVSAFSGRDRIMRAYDEAIASGYRFYSYGDAMLLEG